MHPVRYVVCVEQKGRGGKHASSESRGGVGGKETGQLVSVIVEEKRGEDLQGTRVLPSFMTDPPRTAAPWYP